MGSATRVFLYEQVGFGGRGARLGQFEMKPYPR